jgi:hypothetical protein
MRTKLCPVRRVQCARQVCLADRLCDERDTDHDDDRPRRRPGPAPLRPHLEDA